MNDLSERSATPNAQEEIVMRLRTKQTECCRPLLRGALCLLGCLAVFNAVSPARGAITVLSGFNEGAAYRGSDGLYHSDYALITAPPQITAISAVAGVSTFATDYSSLNTSGQAIFEWGFTHTRDGARDSSGSSDGHMVFTVDVDSSYSVSGLYQLVGDERIYESVTLYDITSNTFSLFSVNDSRTTPNETLREILSNVVDRELS
jgi:hypothetical protein